MKTFLCEVHRDGKTQRLIVKFESAEAARENLISKQWTVLSITEIAVR